MKIHNITEGYSYMSDVDPQPEQSVVDKFAGVADSQRSYYIMKWAEEKGMKTDDAMFKAGYIKDGYIGAGAWNWRYVGMGESVQEDKGYTFDTDGPDLVITSPEGKTKVLKDFSYFDEDPSQAELKSFFYRGKSLRDESIEEAESNMIGEPDSYYDAEDRTEAYNDLQDILQGNFMDDYIKDGVCPECAGSGYMDGEETFTNDDGEEEESSECMGFGNYGCDEGEMTQNDDGLPNWAEIAKHDESQAEKANRGPAPSQEQIMKILPRLHDEYVKSGRYNAFELPSILRQMYPELGKRQASSYVADFFKTFEEDLDEVAGAKDCWDGYKKDGTQPGTGKNKGKRVNKCKKIEGIEDGEITKDSVKNSALELLVDIAKTSKQYKGEVTKDQVHYLGSLVHDFDMAGIETEKYSEIEKLFRTMSDTQKADMTMIQPAYAQAKNLDEEDITTNRLSREEIELEQGFEEMMGQFGEERTDEFFPAALAVPALITAARVAAPKLIQLGARILAGGAKTAAKHPVATGVIGGGAYVGKKAGDAIDDLATSASDLIAKAEGGVEAIQGEISAFLGSGAVKQVAAMAAKYALPALAVVALLYGGKKVIDMLRGNDDDEMQTASIEENDLEEAYINTSKDAVEVLGALRGMGKKIERGQDDDQGNLANAYVSDTWDVYSFIEARTNGFSGLEKNAKQAIEAMMKLRGEAKKLETKTGSGLNARFGNQIVNTLYPVMEYLYTTDFDRTKEDDTMAVKIDKDGAISKDDGEAEKKQKTPIGEFILSYFDKETGEFPKGETAVLTMIEKDYGEQFIEPAKAFIEQVQAKFEEYQMQVHPQQMETDAEYNRMRELAGLR